MVQRASNQLRKSSKLAKILEFVLAMGNYMNRGHNRISKATGFRIHFLAEVKRHADLFFCVLLLWLTTRNASLAWGSIYRAVLQARDSGAGATDFLDRRVSPVEVCCSWRRLNLSRTVRQVTVMLISHKGNVHTFVYAQIRLWRTLPVKKTVRSCSSPGFINCWAILSSHKLPTVWWWISV